MRYVWLIVWMCSGCNVFYGVGGDTATPPGPGPSTSDSAPQCSDGEECDLDCDGCAPRCSGDSTCSGAVSNAGVLCGDAARCELGCVDGACEFDCTSGDSICFVDCADGARCELDCGTERPSPRRRTCGFVTCAQPAFCGDGRLVCNRSC